MNQIIKEVLAERGEQAEAPYVDTAALIQRGRRRRYAKRGGGTVLVAAAAAAAIALAPNVVDQLSDDDVANPAPDLNLAWADGDYLYLGDDRAPRPQGYFDLATDGERVIYAKAKRTTPATPSTSGGRGPEIPS